MPKFLPRNEFKESEEFADILERTPVEAAIVEIDEDANINCNNIYILMIIYSFNT